MNRFVLVNFSFLAISHSHRILYKLSYEENNVYQIIESKIVMSFFSPTTLMDAHMK